MFKKLFDKLFKKQQKSIPERVKETKKELFPKDGGLMHMSKRGMIELAGHEGIVLSKYKCSAGVWTVGIGATHSVVPDLHKWPMDKTITLEESFDLFRESLKGYENAVRKALTVEVSQNVFDALVSWCYNVGKAAPRRSTVIRLINKGVPTDSKKLYNALLMWKKPKSIIARRTKEAKLMTTGKCSNKGRVTIYPVNSKGKPLFRNGKTINASDYLGE